VRRLRPFGLLALTVLICGQAPAPVLVDLVVNPQAPPKAMGRKSASEVFMLRRQFWSNRQPIVLVLQPNDSALQAAFCAKVLEAPCEARDEAELEKRYQGNLFARTLRATSAADAARLLLQNPMAIGYFRRGTAPSGSQVVLQP
jgi:hypothetical protein